MGEELAQVCRPLRRDAERNRQRILAAARGLVAEHGLAVSHDQIAEAADVAVGTVYRRFPDKDSLLEALFVEDADHVVRITRSALEIEDPWQALVYFFDESLALQAGNRGLKEFLMGNVTTDTMTTCRARIIPAIEELVVRGQSAGVLRPDLTVYDIGLVPLMLGPVMDGCRSVRPDLWRRSLDIVLSGLRACPEREPLPDTAATPEDYLEIMRCCYPIPARR